MSRERDKLATSSSGSTCLTTSSSTRRPDFKKLEFIDMPKKPSSKNLNGNLSTQSNKLSDNESASSSMDSISTSSVSDIKYDSSLKTSDSLSSVSQASDKAPMNNNALSKSKSKPVKRRDQLTRKQKVATILKAINSDPVKIYELRRMAIGRCGLLTDELRHKAWPKLLNVNVFNIPPKPAEKVLKAHKDYNQVVMDVNRSLKRFPPGMKDEQRLTLQDQLVDIIMRVLVRHPDLHYYQGYHDICVTFLLVVGEDVSYALVDKLSTHHLRDFMDTSMERTNQMLNYLYPIIGRASPCLRDYMERAELGTIFCLPWLITWYGHVLSDFRHTVRLYDFFLACHPLMPIYLAAAIVLHREDEVLATECDMAMIHQLLSKIPHDLPVENLVSRAGDLFVQYPPSELAFEASLPYKQSTSISKYDKFKNSTLNQRPDKVLKYSKGQIDNDDDDSVIQQNTSSYVVKYSVWALTAGISAVAFAVINSVYELEWF